MLAMQQVESCSDHSPDGFTKTHCPEEDVLAFKTARTTKIDKSEQPTVEAVWREYICFFNGAERFSCSSGTWRW